MLVGVPVGVLAIGLGGRLAMLLLRPDLATRRPGVTSDDGFEIGGFTLAGTYTLVNVGVAVGLLGALACLVVSPWLVGPTWFRATTVGVTAGALVGSMILHAGGVDFTGPGAGVALPSSSSSPCPRSVGALLLVLVDRTVSASGPAAGRGAAGGPRPPAGLAPGGVAAAAVPVLLGGARARAARPHRAARRCTAAAGHPRRARGLPAHPVPAGLGLPSRTSRLCSERRIRTRAAAGRGRDPPPRDDIQRSLRKCTCRGPGDRRRRPSGRSRRTPWRS